MRMPRICVSDNDQSAIQDLLIRPQLTRQ